LKQYQVAPGIAMAMMGLPLAQETPVVEEVQITEAEGVPTEPTEPRQPAPWWADNFFVPMMLVLLIIWLFIFRPKGKQEKQRVQMLNSLKKGDRIQTIGGILGTVLDVREDEVIVKVDESSNTKITFSRNAIHRVREESKK